MIRLSMRGNRTPCITCWHAEPCPCGCGFGICPKDEKPDIFDLRKYGMDFCDEYEPIGHDEEERRGIQWGA